MAETGESGEEHEPSKGEVRWLGLNWNEADLKSGIITVGGTIVGGLLVVVLIGVAFPISRYVRTFNTSPVFWIEDAVVAVVVIPVMLVAVLGKHSIFNRYFRWATLVIVVMFIIEYGLALVGIAAGIK